MATDTTTTIARPYAKAIFEIALENNELQKWSDLLYIFASISLDKDVVALIEKPGFPIESQITIFEEVAGSLMLKEAKNFLKLLAENKRLLVLADIKANFEMLKAEQEKSLDVTVISFDAMSNEQKEALAQSLKKRMNRDISINETIDKSILGGAIVRAGDLVIDGSVRGKLNKLKAELAA
jgi:F-type H+-transporting ATPase subunit delta